MSKYSLVFKMYKARQDESKKGKRQSSDDMDAEKFFAQMSMKARPSMVVHGDIVALRKSTRAMSSVSFFLSYND